MTTLKLLFNMDAPIDEVKIVKCKYCGVDVKVNASYPISEVGCRRTYCPDFANSPEPYE